MSRKARLRFYAYVIAVSFGIMLCCVGSLMVGRPLLGVAGAGALVWGLGMWVIGIVSGVYLGTAWAREQHRRGLL